MKLKKYIAVFLCAVIFCGSFLGTAAAAVTMPAGVSEDRFYAELDDMSGDALADGCTATNPRKVTKEEIRQIYEKAYFGKLP